MSEATAVFGERETKSRLDRLRLIGRLLWRDKLGLAGLLIIVIAIFVAVFAPWLAPHDPQQQDLRNSEMPPAWSTLTTRDFDFGEDGGTIEVTRTITGSWNNPLGTDALGRDQLSRIIYGTRVSLTVGFLGAAMAATIGLTLGMAAAYLGGRVDSVIVGVVNLLLAVPYLVVVIVLAAILGRSLLNVILLFGITDAPIFVRLTRGEVLKIRRSGYVESARAIGATTPAIMFQHILPNLIGPLVTLATFEMSAMIFYEAGLSFLGLSVPPNVPTWGNMLSVGRESLLSGQAWLSVYPGLAIAILSLGMNLFGDWLRDVLDPKLRRGRT